MSAPIEPSVLWREGMFLAPQHMQAFSREIHSRIGQQASFGAPGTFGVARLKIEDELLERDVFAIEEASVQFRDGTLAHFPETGSVGQREFASFFQRKELQVWLGVPAPGPNVPQVAADGDPGIRYRAQIRPTYDENLRDATQDLEFREIQGRLFFGDEDRTGYECIPIARMERHGKPEAKTRISPRYVPPVLRVGASPVLVAHLREMAETLRAQARDLAARIPSTSGLSSVERGADIAGFVKLQAVNQSVALADQVAGLPDLHPFAAYQRLVQTVGNLAVFGTERVMPELPVYDHEDADRCFGAVFEAIRNLVVAEVAVPYDTVAFRPDPVREGFFECELPTRWLDEQPVFYLAVELGEAAETVIENVAVGVKLVSPSDIERVLQGVVPGIRLDYERTPPTSFPKRADLHYFRIETEAASRDAWLRVLESRSAVLLSTLGTLGEVGYHMYVELPS